MKFTVINYARQRHHIGSIHKAGCRAIRRDKARHGGQTHDIEADDVEEALDIWIDPEMQELGYTPSDMKIHNCTKDT